MIEAYLYVAAMCLLACGQVLTHSRWDSEKWRKPRIGRWDYWHMASGLVNYPLPGLVWWFEIPGWELKALAAAGAWLPWVLLRPRHWGYSLWDLRRYL